MNKLWSDIAWEEYLQWQMLDKKTLKKINSLIKDIERNGLSEGIGKPEPLILSSNKKLKTDISRLFLQSKAESAGRLAPVKLDNADMQNKMQ